jgi:hypothetical protein
MNNIEKTDAKVNGGSVIACVQVVEICVGKMTITGFDSGSKFP